MIRVLSHKICKNPGTNYLPFTDKWFGVTYKEDKEAVVESFKKLIEDGVHSEELYEDLIW